MSLGSLFEAACSLNLALTVVAPNWSVRTIYLIQLILGTQIVENPHGMLQHLKACENLSRDPGFEWKMPQNLQPL